jgi:hypothetical protein
MMAESSGCLPCQLAYSDRDGPVEHMWPVIASSESWVVVFRSPGRGGRPARPFGRPARSAVWPSSSPEAEEIEG